MRSGNISFGAGRRRRRPTHSGPQFDELQHGVRVDLASLMDDSRPAFGPLRTTTSPVLNPASKINQYVVVI